MSRPAHKSKSPNPQPPPRGSAHSYSAVWLLTTALVLVTLALYWPATSHEFINYDDPVHVTENMRIQAGFSWENLCWAFGNPLNCIWHPLTTLSHMLDCQWFGVNPWGHHLSSIVLHALNSGLVFLSFRRLTGTLWPSAWLAALFAWHPLHVESVAWVAERKDVLSGCFGWLALLFYARHARNRIPIENTNPATGRTLWLDYALALFFLGLGLLSKPMLVTWPCVLLLLDYWPLGRFHNLVWAKLLREKIPFFTLAAAAGVITFLVQKQAGALSAGAALPLSARVGNALISYCRYLAKILWPTDLSIFYPHPGHWPVPEVLLASGLLMVLSALAWRTRREHPYLLMGWLWFIGTLVPVIQVLQTGAHAMADRYTYIPALGVFIMIIWSTAKLAARRHWPRQLPGLAGAALLVACLIITRRQLAYWQDSERLFRHSLHVTTNNPIAHNNLALALDKPGTEEEAIMHFQEAIRLKSEDPEPHYNIGNTLARRGLLDEALGHYETAFSLGLKSADLDYNLGNALQAKNRLDEAIGIYQQGLRLNPDHAQTHSNLGIAFQKRGRLDEAIVQYRRAIDLQPGYAPAHNNLGAALNEKMQVDEAISQLEEALRLQPDYSAARANLETARSHQLQPHQNR